MSWVIYGATGYSGGLLAERAAEAGLKPLLSARNEEKLKVVAQRLGLEYQVADVNDSKALTELATKTSVIVNCAGPFSATANQVIAACIAGKAHYIDITGEMSIFEYVQTPEITEAAKAAGIVVCPGAGFDVVPTDCLAATLAQKLPSATELELGFAGSKQLSQGTAKTTVEGLAKGGCSRFDGQLKPEPVAQHTAEIDFGGPVGKKFAMTIPWGDISTAFSSTKIPNIKVFIPASKATADKARGAYKLRWLFGLKLVQNFLKRRIEKTVVGPDADARAKSRMQLWGKATDAQGNTVEATFSTPNGYELTVTAPLAIAEYLAKSVDVSGSMTPSQLMGADFVWTLPDVEEINWR